MTIDYTEFRDLQRRVEYLVKRACERSGHDFGTWHRLQVEPKKVREVRYCACCGKGDMRVPPVHGPDMDEERAILRGNEGAPEHCKDGLFCEDPDNPCECTCPKCAKKDGRQ